MIPMPFSIIFVANEAFVWLEPQTVGTGVVHLFSSDRKSVV